MNRSNRGLLTDADILAIAGRIKSCPIFPWWLEDDVAIRDVQAAVLRFARALLVANAEAEQHASKLEQGDG